MRLTLRILGRARSENARKNAEEEDREDEGQGGGKAVGVGGFCRKRTHCRLPQTFHPARGPKNPERRKEERGPSDKNREGRRKKKGSGKEGEAARTTNADEKGVIE